MPRASTDTSDAPPRYGLLRDVRPLRELVAQAGRDTLGTAGQLAAVDEALEMLSGAYVHLPMKRALYAVDPEAALRRLAREIRVAAADPALEPLGDRAFHDEMLGVFASLRDLHTIYELPEPWRSAVAFLPLLIEECSDAPWDGSEASAAAARRFIVTKAAPDAGVAAGDEVTHWGAVPIARAVARSAARHPGGGNPDARLARGLERLTYRWLGSSPLPDEDWATITVTGPDGVRDVRLEWRVGRVPPTPPARRRTGSAALRQGMDPHGETVRRVKRDLFAAGGDELVRVRRFPDPGVGPYVHLRLHSFDVPDPDAFVHEVARVLAGEPDGGLLLDVRGNPGGDIAAGEGLLQLLLPGPIVPQPLQFRATAVTQRLVADLEAAGERGGVSGDALLEALGTGAPWARGTPLTDPAAANAVGQVYHGPVLVAVDALSYSTADIFAAGVQDHPRGLVLGTSGRTGAGGGNGWSSGTVRGLLGRSAREPRTRPRLQLAVRRSLRVGEHDGVVLEDFGVVPDDRYLLTREDVLGDNAGLLAHAAAVLEALGPAPRLDVTLRARSARLRTAHVARVEAFLGERPLATAAPADGALLELPPRAKRPPDAPLVLRAYDDADVLVASRRVALR